MKKISLTLLTMALIGFSMGQNGVSKKPMPAKPSPADNKKTEAPAAINNLASIKFETLTFDFKTIKEEKGPATCVFKFKNTGKKDIQILNVRPSCGCTTSEYTKEAVKPGGSGFVKATYDPKNRPGVFNKTIAVTTNDSLAPNITLIIKGNVLPRPKTREEEYPQQQGALRFKTNHLSYNLTNKESKTDTLTVINAGTKRMQFNYDKIPAYVTIMNPILTKLDTGKVGKIIVKFDAAKRAEIGSTYDKFSFSTNDTAQVEKTVYLSANISEDFTKMTPEELANAPVINIDQETYDFGKVKLGEMVEHNFSITNTGKSKLIFRKVKASCGCTATQPEKMEVEPGETTRIKATFNTTGKMGQQHKTITVITNDPKKSNVTLVIQGEVIKEDAIEIKGDPKKGEGSGTIYKVN